MTSDVLFFCVWYYVALVFSVHFGLIGCDEALLFDLSDATIVQKPSTVYDESEIICKNCASACPASTPEDSKYNYEKSFGKKVSFLKQVYKQLKNIDEIELPECDGAVEPSIVINTSRKLLETGYEVHDRDDKIKMAESENNIKLLQSNNKFDLLLPLYPSDPEQKSNPRDAFSKFFKSGKIIHNIPPVKKHERKPIIWLPILSIILNVDSLSPIQIEYNPDSGQHWWRENCNSFDIGKEFYSENSLASFYAHENQRILFTGTKNQSALSLEKNASESSGEKFDCGQNYGCLIQHQIVPSYYFHSHYGSLALCTFMNTVPVWDSIAERINMIDKYLYAMTRIWQSIRIINRFFGIFVPSREYFKEIPLPEQELYLDQLDNVAVPAIIFKSVTYGLKNSNFLDGTERYTAIVVIHNDPTPNAVNSRICKNERERLSGWEAIENEEFSSGLTYVCRLSRNVAGQLDIPGKEYMPDNINCLNLDEFPSYDDEEKVHSNHDARMQIKVKIKQLFEKKAL